MKSFKQTVLDALLVFLLDGLSWLIDAAMLWLFALITWFVLSPIALSINDLSRLFLYILCARVWLSIVVWLIRTDWKKVG